MASISLKAYAKINLTLEVLGKRPDGFHEVATILQTVDLADELTLAIDSQVTVQGDTEGIAMEDNLILRAARALQTAHGVRQGARITFRKHIPLAAGLGGGSADAAATLRGLVRLWGLQTSLQQLSTIAATLGSDVPFFLHGGAALGSGRGELITPLPSLSDHWFVLATPPLTLAQKTPSLYRALKPSNFTTGDATQRLADALRAGRQPREDAFTNVFDSVADGVFAELAAYRRLFLESGAVTAHLAGSGPTLFTTVADPQSGAAIRDRCTAHGFTAHLVQAIANTYNFS